MLRRLLASCNRVNAGQKNQETTDAGLGGFAALATAILFRAKFLRFGIPRVGMSKASRAGK